MNGANNTVDTKRTPPPPALIHASDREIGSEGGNTWKEEKDGGSQTVGGPEWGVRNDERMAAEQALATQSLTRLFIVQWDPSSLSHNSFFSPLPATSLSLFYSSFAFSEAVGESGRKRKHCRGWGRRRTRADGVTAAGRVSLCLKYRQTGCDESWRTGGQEEPAASWGIKFKDNSWVWFRNIQ